MTAARTITLAQRFGVWKAGKSRCFWCREPVLFGDCQVDHVIPLNAVSTNNEAMSVRRLYDLPDDFGFDHFGNWVPSHPGCNQRKSFTLLDPTPAFALHLLEARALATEAAVISREIDKDTKRAALLVKVSKAISEGDITRQDIEQLFAGLPEIVRKGLGFLQPAHLMIALGWIVTEVDGLVISITGPSSE